MAEWAPGGAVLLSQFVTAEDSLGGVVITGEWTRAIEGVGASCRREIAAGRGMDR